MRTSAEPPTATGTRPEWRAAAGAGPRRGARRQRQPVIARPRPRRGRKVLRTVASAAVVAAAFGFALPHIASYRSVWASLQAMTWPYAVLIGVAAAASLASYWFLICAVLPSLRLREAAVVNLSSSAVANTLPAGGALGMGVSWAILSSWGISTADYVLYTLVSGIWNVFARLGLPVLALLVLMTATRPDAVLIAAAAVGLALLAALAAGLGLLLRSESFALHAGQTLQHAAARACRLARRQAPSRIARSLADFRDRAAGLLAARGRRITVATVASNLILWLVLLACLRGTGLSQAQVPVADLPGRVRVRPAADRPAHHPGRSRDHRARPSGHPGRRRRPAGQRTGDRRRPVVPGPHLPAAHPPRRSRLADLAARPRAHPPHPSHRCPGKPAKTRAQRAAATPAPGGNDHLRTAPATDLARERIRHGPPWRTDHPVSASR